MMALNVFKDETVFVYPMQTERVNRKFIRDQGNETHLN